MWRRVGLAECQRSEVHHHDHRCTVDHRAAPTVPPTTTPAATGPYWLIEDFTLALLERNGLPASTITGLFNSPRTLLIVRPHGGAPDSLVPLATRVQSFASFTTMQSAILGSTIEPGVKYVLYDNEAWASTPANEKAAPFTFAAQALALAHAHGLQLIFTPAANLTPILNPGYTASNQLASGRGKFSGYLGLNVAGQGAAASDVIEIQGQQAENEPGFTTFVSSGRGPGPGGRSHPSGPARHHHLDPRERSGQCGHADRRGGRHPVPGRRVLAEHPRPVPPVPQLRTGQRRSRRLVPRVVRGRLGGLRPPGPDSRGQTSGVLPAASTA